MYGAPFFQVPRPIVCYTVFLPITCLLFLIWYRYRVMRAKSYNHGKSSWLAVFILLVGAVVSLEFWFMLHSDTNIERMGHTFLRIDCSSSSGVKIYVCTTCTFLQVTKFSSCTRKGVDRWMDLDCIKFSIINIVTVTEMEDECEKCVTVSFRWDLAAATCRPMGHWVWSW